MVVVWYFRDLNECKYKQTPANHMYNHFNEGVVFVYLLYIILFCFVLFFSVLRSINTYIWIISSYPCKFVNIR